MLLRDISFIPDYIEIFHRYRTILIKVQLGTQNHSNNSEETYSGEFNQNLRTLNLDWKGIKSKKGGKGGAVREVKRKKIWCSKPKSCTGAFIGVHKRRPATILSETVIAPDLSTEEFSAWLDRQWKGRYVCQVALVQCYTPSLHF